MPKSSALFAVCFVAGLLGALGSSLFLWQCYQWGLINLIGVKVVGTLSLPKLYPQLFIGGGWGLIYFSPLESLATDAIGSVRHYGFHSSLLQSHCSTSTLTLTIKEWRDLISACLHRC